MRLLAAIVLASSALVTGAAAALVSCGPFGDVDKNDPFCPFVLEVFYAGITTGTTATTYDPTLTVNRIQMAAFLSRTVDRVLQRGSRRAALQRFWTAAQTTTQSLATVTLPAVANSVQFDGADLWVSLANGKILRVRASDGAVLEEWSGASTPPRELVMAMGRVFVLGYGSPGALYQIDPSQPSGSVTTVASTLGDSPQAIVFDGARFWTSNFEVGKPSISIVTPGSPWTVTTVTAGFQAPQGIVYDGANVWVPDHRNDTYGALLKLDSSGAVIQTVTVNNPRLSPIFDGSNIWVPGDIAPGTVVRASSGAIVATLNLGGYSSFDGERVLSGGALFKAADLSLLGFTPVDGPSCSDGMSFWVANGARLIRY